MKKIVFLLYSFLILFKTGYSQEEKMPVYRGSVEVPQLIIVGPDDTEIRNSLPSGLSSLEYFPCLVIPHSYPAPALIEPYLDGVPTDFNTICDNINTIFSKIFKISADLFDNTGEKSKVETYSKNTPCCHSSTTPAPKLPPCATRLTLFKININYINPLFFLIFLQFSPTLTKTMF